MSPTVLLALAVIALAAVPYLTDQTFRVILTVLAVALAAVALVLALG